MKVQETLGGYLRALREEREGSLQEMSLATRVSLGQLEALEADRIVDLPAPVFVKGFIRAYCHFLDQPPDEALDRYNELLVAAQPRERAAPPVRPANSHNASAVVISLVLLIVLGAGLAALKLGWKSRPTPAVVAVAPAGKVKPTMAVEGPTAAVEEPATAAVERPTATETATSAAAPAVTTAQGAKVEPPVAPVAVPAPIPASPASASPAGQTLTVKAIELTWLRIQIDDGAAADALLPAGATREWRAAKRFVLTVGNAGGVELLLNGQPVPPLGARGVVIRGLELPRAGAGSGS